MLCIGGGNPEYLIGYPKSKPLIIGSNKYYKEGITRCAEAIIWSYQGISKLLDYFEIENNIDAPFDTKLCALGYVQGILNNYWTEFPLVKQGSIIGLYDSHLR